jgi:maleate isomerase
MDITDNYSIALVSPDEIAEFAEAVVADVEADGVFISCTNLRAAEAADQLAQRLRKPVVTSNLAAADEALRRMGLPTTGVGMP